MICLIDLFLLYAGGKHSTEVEFMSIEEIDDQLSKNDGLNDCTDEFRNEIAEKLYR